MTALKLRGIKDFFFKGCKCDVALKLQPFLSSQHCSQNVIFEFTMKEFIFSSTFRNFHIEKFTKHV